MQKADLIERSIDRFFAIGNPEIGKTERDLSRVQVSAKNIWSGVLEDKADILCQFGNGTGFRILSENFDIARRGHKKTVELLDKRGLPGAVLTDNLRQTRRD